MKLKDFLKGLLPTRAVVGIMMFMACLITYMLRVNMSINLIAMVEPTGSRSQQSTTECISKESKELKENSTEIFAQSASLPDYGRRYAWDQKVQGLILGSYFWGYMLTSIPGGLLAEHFGPVKTITLTTLLSALGTLLTPLAASWHFAIVITLRFSIGFLSGAIYPALHCLMSRWAPPEEKGKFSASLLGGTLGTVLTWPMLGALMESLGWEWAFFVPGGIALLWCIFWCILVADSPEVHTRISDDEKYYILKKLENKVTKTKAIPPYKQMLFSIPFWALVILHIGNTWGLYLLLTAGPKYMSEILHFNIGHSGLLASLPYLLRMLCGFGFGFLGDTIRKHNWMTTTVMRKSFVVFSHFLPGLLLFGQVAAGCNSTLSVTLIALSMGFNGACALTNLINAQDLAPNFAGSIYGVVNCIGSTAGFLTPMVTGFITQQHNGMKEWHMIFCIGATVYVTCGIIFCIFGTAQMQDWNNVDRNVGVENLAFNETTEENTKV